MSRFRECPPVVVDVDATVGIEAAPLVQQADPAANTLVGSPDRYSPIGALAQLKKTPQQLQSLLEDGHGSPACPRTRLAVHNFYEQQNELIDQLLETQAIHRGQYTNDGELEDAQVRRAMNASFASNCVLLAVRLGIAFISGSLSLLVATLDAVLDVVSSAIMYYTSWQAKRENKYKASRRGALGVWVVWYPVGKERMEPLGIIVFSVIMGTAAFTAIMESVKSLVSSHEEGTKDMPMMGWVVGGTVGVVVMKLCLFLYCRNSRNPAVQAFALDHLNDVLVNAVGLGGALLGAHVADYLDAVVAITLSLWMVWAWGQQARQHILNLVGRAPPPSLLQKMTYLTYYHDPRITHIDTVRAFSFGHKYIAEVDIVLPEDMPLGEAHDIGESLQFKLEMLPEVARAYVHLDHEYAHIPEH
eukprot:scaffold15.g4344.t1